MDRSGQFIDIGEFDVDTVDLNAAPQSAEHYLQQVIADRLRGPSYVSVTRPDVSTATENNLPPTTRAVKRDPRAPSREWCVAKVAEFSAVRSRMESAPREKALFVNWPCVSDAEKWETLLLRECHPNCVQFSSAFPRHQGTPPAVPIVLGLSSLKVNYLIRYAVEWAERDGFSRPLREWLFSLLAVVQKPLLPEVCAAVRELANFCRKLRSTADMERKDEIRELSWFITIVGEYFGQADLADL